MKSFVHSGGVSRLQRVEDNAFHLRARIQVDRLGLKPMARETAAGARKFGGNAASVHRRVERKAPWEPRSFTEDNAFHLTL